MEVGKEREQDAVSFTYMEVGKEREQDMVALWLRVRGPYSLHVALSCQTLKDAFKKHNPFPGCGLSRIWRASGKIRIRL